MQVRQISLERSPAADDLAALAAIGPQLVLVFGSVGLLSAAGLLEALRAAFPTAALAGCTAANQISQAGVCEGQLVVTAVHFDAPGLDVALTSLDGRADSEAAGLRLGLGLLKPGLHAVLVLGQGFHIDGDALLNGLGACLPPEVAVFGGLAGDDGAFEETLTLSRHAVSAQQLVAVGFSAPRTRLRHGCDHGWKPFGPARRVTRSDGNVLYELDGQPALELYKRYLGEHAKALPHSGLQFPFEMVPDGAGTSGLIRALMGVDEANGSLVLGGDLVEQGYIRLMHASTDSLVNGAATAAERAFDGTIGAEQSLALVVSCSHRRLAMGTRTAEEVEEVANVLGPHAQVAGFYSNAEISPSGPERKARLHNQTMTVTHISELAP